MATAAAAVTTDGADVANHNPLNGGSGSGNDTGRNHVVLFPFMAKGHTLPLLHFAKTLTVLYPGQRLRVTLLTTPANLAFARRRLPASVHLAALPFPSLSPLPPGVESTDALPSPSLYPTFLRATALLREPFAEFLVALPSRPLVLVSDFFLGFTHRVAGDAGVRRVVFHGMSCFSVAICKSLVATPPPPPPASSADGGGASFHVSRMPEHVRITAEDVPEAIAKVTDPMTQFIVGDIGDSDERSWGVLVNSFAALDEDYVASMESFYLQPNARAWLVGPLFLAAGDMPEDEEERDPESCLPWLDDRPAESVVYVSFGTEAHLADEQLDELARGLVLSGHPFLWAVRSSTWRPPVDLGPDGRIVRRWIPQRSVLAHRAVGGFVSHCGWNSVMESLAAAKPVLAWPMGAEQHLNARHVTDIIGGGVRMGVSGGGAPPVVVGRTEVEEKVRRLMDTGSEEGRRIRARARDAQQAAETAVAKGGTSHVAVLKLIGALQQSYGDEGESKSG